MSNVLNLKVHVANDEEPIRFHGVNYLSWVNGETYGKPAIIAPGGDGEPTAPRDEYPVTVVYVNPANIIAVEAERES